MALRFHPELAPRGRFRGQRRYFRRVQRDATAFKVDVGSDAWWDHWHYHADWRGWGNRGWRFRGEHIRALCRVFQTIADASERFATPFQAWILISGEDAGQDATYLLTPNANGTPFPVAANLVRWDASPLGLVVRPLLPRLTLEFGVYVVAGDEDGLKTENTTHWIWARGVGTPLLR